MGKSREIADVFLEIAEPSSWNETWLRGIVNPRSAVGSADEVDVIAFDLKVVDEDSMGMVLMDRGLYRKRGACTRKDVRADAKLAEGDHSPSLDIERMLGRCRQRRHDLTARVRQGHRDRLLRQMLVKTNDLFVLGLAGLYVAADDQIVKADVLDRLVVKVRASCVRHECRWGRGLGSARDRCRKTACSTGRQNRGRGSNSCRSSAPGRFSPLAASDRPGWTSAQDQRKAPRWRAQSRPLDYRRERAGSSDHIHLWHEHARLRPAPGPAHCRRTGNRCAGWRHFASTLAYLPH